MQLVVSLSRLRGNIRKIRSIIKSRFCAVVKAEAYGHGFGVVPYIQPIVDCFAVANVDEGIRLVEMGIYKPILVLSGDSAYGYGRFKLYPANIVPSVSSVKAAELVVSKNRAFSVAINTGMNRLGANAEELDRIKRFCYDRGVKPWSVYSHIYNGCFSFREQKSLFERYTCDSFFQGNRHLFSSNVLDMPCYNSAYDMVRMGIAMYGYSSYTSLAMLARAEILKISTVSYGEHIGYGDFIADGNLKVATVGCGYADGFRRSNKPLYMTVRGKRCRVLGQPCMDMTMIDVTNVDCREGEFAYIIKDKSDAQYLADAYGTIIYEVLTSFNGRAERIYV